MRQMWLILLALLALATPATAQLGSVPYTFSPGNTISSSQFNTMFSAIYSNALNRTGGTMTGTLTTLNVLPTADNVSNLGSAALSYHDAWFDGTVTFGGRITSTVTTEQIRAAYDASNYLSITVGSTGGTTFNATGSGAAFTFSDLANFTLGLQERSRTVALGEWQNHTYASGDYTASAGTWTVGIGDVLLNRYTLVGKTATWQINIATTDVSGTPSYLKVSIPNGLTEEAALVRGGICKAVDAGGAPIPIYWQMGAYGHVRLYLLHGLAGQSSTWTDTSGGDNTGILCTIIFELD